MNQTSQGDKKSPLYRRHDSQAECYRKATVPALRAVKTPASPFIPVKMTGLPPIPREEED